MPKTKEILRLIGFALVSVSFCFRWLHFLGGSFLLIAASVVLFCYGIVMLCNLKSSAPLWQTSCEAALYMLGPIAVQFAHFHFAGSALLIFGTFGVFLPLYLIAKAIFAIRK